MFPLTATVCPWFVFSYNTAGSKGRNISYDSWFTGSTCFLESFLSIYSITIVGKIPNWILLQLYLKFKINHEFARISIQVPHLNISSGAFSVDLSLL